jgi:hypothetical protein
MEGLPATALLLQCHFLLDRMISPRMMPGLSLKILGVPLRNAEKRNLQLQRRDCYQRFNRMLDHLLIDPVHRRISRRRHHRDSMTGIIKIKDTTRSILNEIATMTEESRPEYRRDQTAALGNLLIIIPAGDMKMMAADTHLEMFNNASKADEMTMTEA